MSDDMIQDLDQALASLAKADAAPGLATLERDVWTRVAAQAPSRRSQTVRYIAVSVVLAAGVAAGGAAGAESVSGRTSDLAVFSTKSPLSPLARLDGGR